MSLIQQGARRPGASAAAAEGRRPVSEPEERHDPVNDMLTMVEANCRQMIDLGYGAQLEARLARLFPKPAAGEASNASAGKAGTASKRATARIIADAETALAIVYGTEVLRKHAHRLGAESDLPRAMAQACIGLLLERLRASAPPASEGGEA